MSISQNCYFIMNNDEACDIREQRIEQIKQMRVKTRKKKFRELTQKFQDKLSEIKNNGLLQQSIVIPKDKEEFLANLNQNGPGSC